jgi:acyl dehydratase
MTTRWADIKEGQGAPTRRFGPITRTDIVRYQGASGDMNPFHHDDAFAQDAGFAGAFAPGLLSAGYLAAWATEWLGPDNVRRFGVRFKVQVWPGDEVTCGGTVVRKFEEAGEQRVELKLQCTRQNGDVALDGWATFTVDRD